jgi:hypothetical protein
LSDYPKIDEDEADSSILEDERRCKKRLRLTIGTLQTSSMRSTYWSTDGRVKKLLEYRPSIEDMKLILEPMCYLFTGNAAHLGKKAAERDEYFHTLQKQLIEYFLESKSIDSDKNKIFIRSSEKWKGSRLKQLLST